MATNLERPAEAGIQEIERRHRMDDHAMWSGKRAGIGWRKAHEDRAFLLAALAERDRRIGELEEERERELARRMRAYEDVVDQQHATWIEHVLQQAKIDAQGRGRAEEEAGWAHAAMNDPGAERVEELARRAWLALGSPGAIAEASGVKPYQPIAEAILDAMGRGLVAPSRPADSSRPEDAAPLTPEDRALYVGLCFPIANTHGEADAMTTLIATQIREAVAEALKARPEGG